MSKWIEVKITDEMLSIAKKQASKHSDIPNSIMRGGGNLAGYIGEQAVLEHIKDSIPYNTKDCDVYLNPFSDNPISVDVKTKRRRVYPREEYTCHIAEASLHQNCDMYIFCQVNFKRNPKTKWELDTSKAYILGWMTKEDFLKRSIKLKEGQSLKDVGHGDDDKPQRADGNVVLIGDLEDIRKLP